MSTHNSSKQGIAFLGKIVSVILIPLGVYHFMIKPSEAEQAEATKQAIESLRHMPDSPSEAEAIRQKSHEAIMSGKHSVSNQVQDESILD